MSREPQPDASPLLPPPDPDCELCEAAQFTHWYAADDICWIADCEVCLVPMVVWRHHGVVPLPEHRRHMDALLTSVADAHFGPNAWNLDDNMRQIPDHFHAHARDGDWFAKRSQRRLTRFTGVGGERVERG